MDSKLPSSPDWLIDEVFGKLDLHLIAGPSGGGKTTLLSDMLNVFAHGGSWFGHQCYPVPFVYIACERSARNVKETFKRTGWAPPYIIGSTDMATAGLTPERVVLAALAKCPDAKLLIMEGLPRLVPKGKLGDATAISDFLVGLQKLCEKRDLTMILVTWAPKQSERDRYTNPRQRCMGSVAFAGCTSTIILIEPEKDGRTRCLRILRQNYKDEEFYLIHDAQGRLQQVEAPTTLQGNLREYILSFDNDFRFDIDDLETAFPSIHKRMINRALANLTTEHEIVRLCRGKYRRTKSPESPQIMPHFSNSPIDSIEDTEESELAES